MTNPKGATTMPTTQKTRPTPLRRRTALGALAGLGAAAIIRPARAMDAVSLRLNWILNGIFSVFYYGKDMGFYRDEGIELTIGEGQGSGRTVQSVAAGSDMFGLADGGSIILGASKGAAVKAVMGVMNESPYTISMRADSGARTVKDLVGKTIAVTPGEAGLPLLQAIWAANGIAPDAVHLLNVDGAAKLVAVLDKRVDGLLAGLDSQVVILNHKGLQQVVLLYADMGVNTQGVSLFTTDALIQKNPDLVRRFVRASLRCLQAAEDHPDAVVDAGIKAKPDEDRSMFVDQLKAGKAVFFSPGDTKHRPGYMMPEDWQRTLDLMKRYQDLVTDMPASAFYTDAFLPA
jgi:NitT/TauT family transport system substrate-binding protein